MCVYCSSGLNLGALEFWTVLLITDCSSSMYKTYQVGLMREGKNKPKSFITLQNGIDWFFLPFSGALLVLIAVLCPQKGVIGTSSCRRGSLVSAFPPGQFPLLAPCRSFPHMEERSLHLHGHAGTAFLYFTCHVYQGMVQSLRWQGQLYCLVSLGQGCPSPALLMALGSSLGMFTVGEKCS